MAKKKTSDSVNSKNDVEAQLDALASADSVAAIPGYTPRLPLMLERHTRSRLRDLVIGSNDRPHAKLLKDVGVKETDRLIQKIAGKNPTAIEVILAERIATTYEVSSWLDFQ